MKKKDAALKFHEYAEHWNGNELEILGSSMCCCMHCGNTFSAREVHAWSSDESNLSALCPVCGLPHVVGDSSGLPVDKKTAKVLRDYCVEIMTPEDLRRELIDFCTLFFERRVKDTPSYETVYHGYLLILFHQFNDAYACLALARLYATGLSLFPADEEKAVRYYKDPCLAGDERALYELGILYDTRNKNGDARKAFEAFSKASALGSLAGSTGVAMYYLQGKYVKKDTAFGIAALFSIFDDLYAKAVNQPQYLDTFGFCAYNIGACLEDGVGIAANKDRALRYYLLSRFASDAIIDALGVKAPWGEPAESAVERLAGNLAPDRGNDLVLDEDTFYDSFYEQNDYLSHKILTHIEYSETDGSVHMGLAFDRATLAIDVGNAQTAILSEMEWTFAEAKFELHPTQREFERIEFESPLTAVFIHDDPVLGEVRVLRIEFPPEPEGDERWH